MYLNPELGMRTDGRQNCLVPNDYPEAGLLTSVPDEETCPGSMQDYAARKAAGMPGPLDDDPDFRGEENRDHASS